MLLVKGDNGTVKGKKQKKKMICSKNAIKNDITLTIYEKKKKKGKKRQEEKVNKPIVNTN